jgi:hypothetical protein
MVRVTGIRETALYAVAEPDLDLALKIVQAKVVSDGEHLEDLGRVTGELIAALKLRPGELKKV